MSSIRPAAALALLLGLGACAWFGGGDAGSGAVRACPAVGLLEGAGQSASHAGEARQSADLRYVAGLSRLESTCRYDETGLEVDLAFDLRAERGPALGEAAPSLTYFVAAVAPPERILAKRTFTSEIAFADAESAGFREQLTLRLPAMSEAEAAALRIYVGFQPEAGAGPRPRPGPSLLR